MFINLETPNFLHSAYQHTTHQQAAAAASLAHADLVKSAVRNAVPKVRKKSESGMAFWKKSKTDQNSQDSGEDLQESGVDTVI